MLYEVITRLAHALRTTLKRGIARGGATLRDYCGSDGRTGYFQLSASVYGRAGEPRNNFV